MPTPGISISPARSTASHGLGARTFPLPPSQTTMLYLHLVTIPPATAVRGTKTGSASAHSNNPLRHARARERKESVRPRQECGISRSLTSMTFPRCRCPLARAHRRRRMALVLLLDARWCGDGLLDSASPRTSGAGPDFRSQDAIGGVDVQWPVGDAAGWCCFLFLSLYMLHSVNPSVLVDGFCCGRVQLDWIEVMMS